MPRARLRREPCDCLDCREPAGAPAATATAAAAAARQDPPPKSLVLCLSRALDAAQDGEHDAGLPHLDALVAGGWAGLLVCRAGGPALPLQLLGLQAEGEAPPKGTLPDRFKQLRAVLLTDSPQTAQAGALAGCYAVQPLGSGSSGGGSSGSNGSAWPPVDHLAARIASLLQIRPMRPPEAAPEATAPALAAVLGAAAAEHSGHPAGQQGQQGVEELEGDEVVDMLIVAADAARAPPFQAPQSEGSGGGDGSASLLEWADSLLRRLNAVPGFRDTVLLSVVAGAGPGHPGAQPLLQQAQPEVRGAAAAPADFPPVRRPLQSYQLAGLQRVEVDACRPALVAHRLAGVTRVDGATRLALRHVMRHGAAGCILAERLLPEVAYKLGRAPKYGA